MLHSFSIGEGMRMKSKPAKSKVEEMTTLEMCDATKLKKALKVDPISLSIVHDLGFLLCRNDSDVV